MANRLTGLLEEPQAKPTNRLTGLLKPEKPFPELGRRVVIGDPMDRIFSGVDNLRDVLPGPFGLEMGTIVGIGIDPEKMEADINSALYYSIEMDMPFERAFTIIDQLNMGAFRGQTGSTAWKRIKQRYQAGKAQIKLGDLGASMAATSWADPETFERNLKEVQQLQTQAGNDDVQAEFRGFWEKTFGAAAEQAPQLGEALEVAPAGAVIGGFAGGITAALAGAAIPTVGEEPALITAGVAAGMKIGAGTAMAGRIAQMETGHLFIDLMNMKDASGNRMDPRMAVILSHAGGAINGGIEIAQWTTALKAFGITGKAWTKAGRAVVRKLAKDGTLQSIALNTAGNFGVTLTAEVAQEIGQETTNVVFEAMAVELNKLKGKEFPHITAEALKDRYIQITEQSLRAFGVMLAPGVGISGAIAGMQVRAAIKDDVARKQPIRILRRKLGGITVERQATEAEVEQVGIETEIEPGVFEKLTTEKIPVEAVEVEKVVTPPKVEITAEKRTQAIELIRGLLANEQFAALNEKNRAEIGQRMLAERGIEVEAEELIGEKPTITSEKDKIRIVVDDETINLTEIAREEFDPVRREVQIARFTKEEDVILFRGVSQQELDNIRKTGKITGGKFATPFEQEFGAQFASTLEEARRAAFHMEKEKGVKGQRRFVISVNAKGKLFGHEAPQFEAITPGLEGMVIDKARITGNLGVSIKVTESEIIEIQEVTKPLTAKERAKKLPITPVEPTITPAKPAEAPAELRPQLEKELRKALEPKPKKKPPQPTKDSRPTKPAPIEKEIIDRKDLPPVTTIRKADVAADREALGLAGLPSEAKLSDKAAHAQAIAEGIPDRALRMAAQLEMNPRALSKVEEAGFRIAYRRLVNEHNNILEQVRQTNDEAAIKNLTGEMEIVENDVELLGRAISATSREAGRSLQGLKAGINSNFDLVSVVTRAKANKGENISATERAGFEKLTADLDEANQKIDSLQVQMNELAAQKATKQSSRAKRFSRMSSQQLDTELNTKVELARKLLEKGCY